MLTEVLLAAWGAPAPRWLCLRPQTTGHPFLQGQWPVFTYPLSPFVCGHTTCHALSHPCTNGASFTSGCGHSQGKSLKGHSLPWIGGKHLRAYWSNKNAGQGEARCTGCDRKLPEFKARVRRTQGSGVRIKGVETLLPVHVQKCKTSWWRLSPPAKDRDATGRHTEEVKVTESNVSDTFTGPRGCSL